LPFAGHIRAEQQLHAKLFSFSLSLFPRGMEARASSIYIYTHTSHGWAGFLFELQEARERTNGVLFHRTGRRSYFFFLFHLGALLFPSLSD
jgi:hypothetical protein